MLCTYLQYLCKHSTKFKKSALDIVERDVAQNRYIQSAENVRYIQSAENGFEKMEMFISSQFICLFF